MTLASGTRLAHFELLAPLGAGGMGEVYRARDTELGREVAIKVLPEALAADPAFRARFEREARAVAALSHPNILAIHALGQHEGTRFAVMELLEGETLRQRLARGTPRIEQALAWTAQVARGLAAAHARGIVHRDLKPENVMLGRDERVKILDFGLAKSVEEAPARGTPGLSGAPTRDAALTGAGTLLGTVAYMSPEQARGQAVDAASDLFSLGVLLYELLTGRNPFQGPTLVDTLSAILKDTPRPASALNPAVPPGVDALLARLLAKEPGRRPPSAAVVAEEVLAPAAGPPEGPRPAAAPRSIAVLPFADMSPAKDQAYLCEGLAEELINALAHVENLKVAARTSAFRFRDRALDVRRIGEELGVEAVLEGSVRQAGRRLRVTAQLIDARDGYHLWSERYDRDLQDVFELQDEIAATILATLKVKLGAPRAARPRHATEDVEAFQLYLQGRYWWNKRNEGGLTRSVAFFEQAIARNPAYALAHAGLADSHSVIGYYGFQPPRAAFGKAAEYAAQALAHDDGLAEAHVSLALIRYWHDWDWPGAEAAFRRSLSLRPDHVGALLFFGQFLAATGRTAEAEPLWREVLARDPMSPLTHGIVGSALYFAGRHQEGRQRCAAALTLDPEHVQSLWAGGNNASLVDRHQEAIEWTTRAVSLARRAPIFLGALGQALARAGRRDEAEELLAELESRAAGEYVAPLFRAWTMLPLGRTDEALDLLEQSVENHDPMVIALHTRSWEPVWADPRYLALRRRVHPER